MIHSNSQEGSISFHIRGHTDHVGAEASWPHRELPPVLRTFQHPHNPVNGKEPRKTVLSSANLRPVLHKHGLAFQLLRTHSQWGQTQKQQKCASPGGKETGECPPVYGHTGERSQPSPALMVLPPEEPPLLHEKTNHLPSMLLLCHELRPTHHHVGAKPSLEGRQRGETPS